MVSLQQCCVFRIKVYMNCCHSIVGIISLHVFNFLGCLMLDMLDVLFMTNYLGFIVSLSYEPFVVAGKTL